MPLKGMDLHKKDVKKIRSKKRYRNTENLFRKSIR